IEHSDFESALSLATGTPDLVYPVARGEIGLGTINPTAFLTMAYRGTGPFAQPLPLRTIAMMPSWDRMGFVVSPRTEIGSLSDIKERKFPLRISIRQSQAHATRFVVDEVLGALGTSLEQIGGWGGACQYVDTPNARVRQEGIRDGTIDAVFDEGIGSWGRTALENGWRFLPVEGEALRRMEALGWPVRVLPKDHLPGLDSDIMTPSFSDWPLFTSANTSDDVAYKLIEALDVARPHITWDRETPVELADLARTTDGDPLAVPLHPGAERYYEEHGAI
ncbi:MAG: hypothetical protein HW416_2380, partial [Chloroflexi bacterium]|nr:hypothetical protein [Chloroflexota bacterium]